MQRPVERRRGGGDRGVRVDVRAADAAHGVGAAVLLVVGVQDEEHVERVLEGRIRPVLELGDLEHHVEEVAGVGEVVVRVGVGHAHRVPVGKGGDRRHLGEQPVGLNPPGCRIVNLFRIGVEGRERTHRRDQHPHRMGVVPEAVHEGLDVLVDDRVQRDVVGPLPEVLRGGQLSLDDQVRRLEEGAPLGELLDRVAPIEEHALVAVDVGDAALARRRVHERRVVGHEPRLVGRDADLLEIGRADRAVLDRHLEAAAASIIDDGEALLCHPASWRGKFPAGRARTRST